jgi:MraZ protein
MVPASLKKQFLPVMSEGFVIKRAVFQTCLEMYPLDEWNALMQKMGQLNRFNRKNNDFIRRFTAGVKTVELDAAGRLLIPKDLLSFAGINK